MSKFNIGDLVFIMDDHASGSNQLAGDVGTVTDHYIGHPEYYTVCFKIARDGMIGSWIMDPLSIHAYSPLPSGLGARLPSPTQESLFGIRTSEYEDFYIPPKTPKCECGVSSLRDGGNHSSWCPAKD